MYDFRVFSYNASRELDPMPSTISINRSISLGDEMPSCPFALMFAPTTVLGSLILGICAAAHEPTNKLLKNAIFLIIKFIPIIFF
jgi:hypothetical protein